MVVFPSRVVLFNVLQDDCHDVSYTVVLLHGTWVEKII
jgi:hypothetical protein